MRWFKADKDNCVQPSTGTYQSWKPILAEEARHQCVYCAIPEGRLGGIRNFHVEHYRPKSREEFAELENIIRNLFYSCPICNTFKGDDWPNEPDLTMSLNCYLDPAIIDYNAVFHLQENAEIVGINVSAQYMVEKLYLNRPHLILERRCALAHARLKSIRNRLKENYVRLCQMNDDRSSPVSTQLEREYSESIDRIVDLLQAQTLSIPYLPEDILRR